MTGTSSGSEGRPPGGRPSAASDRRARQLAALRGIRPMDPERRRALRAEHLTEFPEDAPLLDRDDLP